MVFRKINGIELACERRIIPQRKHWWSHSEPFANRSGTTMGKYITGIKAAVAAVVAMMIERDGVRYSEAIDPLDSGRVYTETDEK